MKGKVYLIFLLLFGFSATAQQKPVQAAVDSVSKKIGAQFNLTVRTMANAKSKVIFPSGKNFGQLEVIRDYVVDTIIKDAKIELAKKYGLTQFDSGKYTIPRLPVLIDNQRYFTDSIVVEVADVAVDTLKQKMFDIKPILEAPSNRIPFLLQIYLILMSIVVIGLLLNWLIRKRQLRNNDPQTIKTPYERATLQLQSLEQKQLLQKGQIKAYYSELTAIARTYLEETIRIPAMESTTSELIAAIREASTNKKIEVPEEIWLHLETVLKQADLVKFAKSKPSEYEIAEDRQKTEAIITTINNSVPEMTADEEAMQEQQRMMLQKKQRKNRIVTSVGVVLFLIAATAAYFISTKGLDYVVENVIGSDTKDLAETDWISSEYGNPAIRIETPKVLMRVDPEEALPKESMAFLKEFQTFTFGGLHDDIYIIASTITYKEPTQIDLNLAIEGIINVLELQGAKTILVKQDVYNAVNGISGIKAYGTFTIMNPDNRKKKRAYYEALLFSQENGVQQILTVHEEGDKYGKQISERVLNSVELTKTEQ